MNWTLLYKRSLNISALVWKFVTKIPFSNRGGSHLFLINDFIKCRPVHFKTYRRIGKFAPEGSEISLLCISYDFRSLVPSHSYVLPFFRLTSPSDILIVDTVFALDSSLNFRCYPRRVFVVAFNHFIRYIAKHYVHDRCSKNACHFINSEV